MTTAALNQISRSFDYSNKAYLASTSDAPYQNKSLGRNPELMGWLEGAAAYYNAVQSGEIERPDPNTWNEFLNQRQWAQSQAYGTTGTDWGDPMMDTGGDYYSDQGPSQEAQVNAYGGEQGPKGSWNYDMIETNLGFTGDGSRNDIYGTQNTQNFEQPSAQVSFEITTDHGVQVLKQIVTTAKGTAVYFYDNYASPDFALAVNMADPTKVTGLDSLPADLQAKLKVEKYDPNKKPEEVINQSSVTGKAVEGEENAFYYEAETADQTIDFRLKAGENETHYTVGNSNISFPVSSTADVSEGPFEVNGSTYDFKTVVTHADGSTDTIYTKKPFTVNVNTVESYTTFDGVVPEDRKVPEAFEETFTLNGKVVEQAATDPRNENDTQPDDVVGNEATYNRSHDVELHANFEDETNIHHVSLPGTFTLHTDSFDDTVEVNKTDDGSFQIMVFKKGEHDLSKVEIYWVKGASSIDIDALPENISGDGADDPIIKKSLLPEGEVATDPASQWPHADSIVSNIPMGHNDDWHGGDDTNALNYANTVEEAWASGDWTTVKTWIVDRGAGHDSNVNSDDILRKYLTGLYLSVGSDREEFLKILRLIPDKEVVQTWIDCLGSPTDKQDGDQFNDSGFRALLNESLSE